MTALDSLDLSTFPPGSVRTHERLLCLKCVLQVFTKQLGLKAKTAMTEARNYTPTVEELTARDLTRPFFLDGDHCPYCEAPQRWHARVLTYQIEGSKATDSARRKLVAGLPGREGDFEVLESKTTQAGALAEWLERQRSALHFDHGGWIRRATRSYLERKEPKTDWREVFSQARAIRRSARLEEGWEVDAGRLFLAPPLYYEALVVQYLLSRSQMAGGETMEGRLTLQELVVKLRFGGYLRQHDIHAHNPADVLERVILEISGGGEGSVKYHYVVDRRDLVSTAKDLGSREGDKEKAAAARKAAKPSKKTAVKGKATKAARA